MLALATAIAVALLVVPPFLLALAILRVVWLAGRGTLRRALAYLVVSRPRRSAFGLLVILGLIGFIAAGAIGVMSAVGSLSDPLADGASGIAYLLGALALSSAVLAGLRDSPLARSDRSAVKEFEGELLSLGIAEGVDEVAAGRSP